MQQFIFIYPVFGQFLSFRFSLKKNHSVKTGLKPSSYKSTFLLSPPLLLKAHYVICCLTHNFVIAQWGLAASNINISLLFCSKYTFQKVGSRSPLRYVCYSKNKYEDGEAAPMTNPLTRNISFSTEKPGYPFVYRLLAWTNAGKHRKRHIGPPLQLWAHIMPVNEKKNKSEYKPHRV